MGAGELADLLRAIVREEITRALEERRLGRMPRKRSPKPKKPAVEISDIERAEAMRIARRMGLATHEQPRRR